MFWSGTSSYDMIWKILANTSSSTSMTWMWSSRIFPIKLSSIWRAGSNLFIYSPVVSFVKFINEIYIKDASMISGFRTAPSIVTFVSISFIIYSWSLDKFPIPGNFINWHISLKTLSKLWITSFDSTVDLNPRENSTSSFMILVRDW